MEKKIAISPSVYLKTEAERKYEQMVQLKQIQINALLEITDAINENYPAHELFALYKFNLLAKGVGRLVLLHKNEVWEMVCSSGIQEKNMPDWKQLMGNLMTYNETTYLSEANSLPALSRNFDVVIPVYHKDEALAFVLLGKMKSDEEEFLKFIQTFSNIIVVAIENKRLFKQQIEQERFKKELEVAERVQSMLIPKMLPSNELIEMQAVYMPHFNIGGDYYDYIELSEDEFVTCIGDISGKGIAAALLMANAQAVLRALVRENNNLKDLIQKLNARILEITQGDKFITFFIAKHNLKTKTVQYINAGHNPPLAILKDKITELKKGCTILGVFDELKIEMGELSIEPGTLFFTYTDGLTDLENEEGDYFKTDLLYDFIKENISLSVFDFHQALINRIHNFKGQQVFTDDISILSYRIF